MVPLLDKKFVLPSQYKRMFRRSRKKKKTQVISQLRTEIVVDVIDMKVIVRDLILPYQKKSDTFFLEKYIQLLI